MLIRQLPNGRLLMDREALATLTDRSEGAVRQAILRANIQPVRRERERRLNARDRVVPLYDALTVAEAIERTRRRNRAGLTSGDA